MQNKNDRCLCVKCLVYAYHCITDNCTFLPKIIQMFVTVNTHKSKLILVYPNIYNLTLLPFKNRIGGEMVSVLASSAVDRVFEHRSGQTKTIQLVCVDSPLSTQHSGERAKTGWLEIRIMCSSGATCLPTTVVSVS